MKVKVNHISNSEKINVRNLVRVLAPNGFMYLDAKKVKAIEPLGLSIRF